jgi:hypothetical protein
MPPVSWGHLRLTWAATPTIIPQTHQLHPLTLLMGGCVFKLERFDFQSRFEADGINCRRQYEDPTELRKRHPISQALNGGSTKTPGGGDRGEESEVEGRGRETSRKELTGKVKD